MHRLKLPPPRAFLGAFLVIAFGAILTGPTLGRTTLSAAEWKRLDTNCANQKDIEKQIDACTSLLTSGTLTPKNRAIILYNRATAYGTQLKYDLALADIEQSITLDPKKAIYYWKKGDLHFSLREYEKTLSDFDASLRLDPNDIGVRSDRGAVLMRLGRPAEVIPDVTAMIERGGNRVTAGHYNLRAIALIELGRREEAKPDCAKAEAHATLKLESNRSNLIERAFARVCNNNPDGAIADVNEYLAASSSDESAHEARALAYAAKKDHTKALADFSEAIRLGGKGFLLRERGDAYLAANQPEQAIIDYQAQLSLTPTNALATIGLEKARQALSAKLAATAGTPQGSNASATAGSLQAATLGAPPSQAKAELGRRVALVIGNSAYANVAALPNPKNDAAKVADTLRKIGFAEVTLVEDTDFRSLNRALQHFAGQADGADWAVIYYAGHGIEIANTNYLVPVDARLASDRDVTFEAVPLDRVMAASEGAKGMRLVILDACRNNPFLANMTRKTATRAVSRGLSRVEPDGGTLVVYAAKAGEVALDGSGGNSPFVTALTANLQKPGIEIGKLFRLVRDDVMKATDRKQEPFTYGSLPGEDFVFNPG
ncbi:caspase family protein [Labrys sp. LIt4]|uniref:caspase family protein n=1 Tax=Labrys sp. LIt4 TaxID=2821355 RepID=UPI001ADEECE3|nr:caspase family protein [Labrys sp. LIt4]MBP0582223.1 caspase family protein [Labrys sp. LIt4]